MSDTMVETVARALAKAFYGEDGWDWTSFEGEARAAIAAMRLPLAEAMRARERAVLHALGLRPGEGGRLAPYATGYAACISDLPKALDAALTSDASDKG
jgi:hypothetical protein